MNRQWNIISVPYFPPNFQQALTYARSKVLKGTDEEFNLLGCHNKSTGEQLAFWKSTLPHLQSVAFHSSSISIL